ncbi:hypothetical protein DOTSEDRAFT_174149 [Dothistroma septosporum NZE10]|uniref:MARVEL domain-containing protein n=1 Tax=Dothistroma septosporum (strain NZE10 / CBS 128990) TaxID=675120 RepID=M2Y507_DOTSN|nr:hypothetical protein DOTSEDRAFT_174149 [Dothistroma septosporum NZE10]
MRVPQSKLQRLKAAMHLAQAVLVFVAGCLTLAVMTKAGGYGGQVGYYFALCFITIPAILYQVTVPMWTRAWRLNNVWAIAIIDILFTLLWFAAAIAVAVWNANGLAAGKETTGKTTTKRDTHKDGTCASFGYGSKSKCEVSKANIGFGIIISLLFGVCSYIAIRAVMEYRRTGVVHGPSSHYKKNGAGVSTEDDAEDKVWSANVNDLNGADDRLAYRQHDPEDRTGLLNGHLEDSYQPSDGMAHPGRRPSWESQTVRIPPSYDSGFALSALSPTGLPTGATSGEIVQFPEANYSRI